MQKSADKTAQQLRKEQLQLAQLDDISTQHKRLMTQAARFTAHHGHKY